MKTKVFIGILITLLITIAFSDVTVENGMVCFYFESETASTVYLVGNFNDWDPFATPMKGEDGEWFVELKLKPGVYQYAFVINGTKTVEDPNEYGSIKNELGTYNSVFVLKLSGSKLVIDPEASRNYAKTVEKKEKEKSKTEISLPEDYEANTPKNKKLSPKMENGKVVFSFVAPENTKIVYLAGSFNSWSSNKLPMVKNGKVWQVGLKLKDGIYQYKFVINGSTWKEDPNSYGYVPDGYGGKNSVVIIKALKIYIPSVKPSSKTAVTIEKPKAIKGGPAIEGNTVVFRFKYPSASSVCLAGTFNNWNKSALPMKLVNGFWEARLQLQPGSYEYKFVVDGSTWIEDPNAFEYVPDPYGGKNSVITLKEENGKLTIVKPKKANNTSPLNGNMEFKFGIEKNALWFSSQGYNMITLQLKPKIPNVEFSSRFNVNTVGWAVDFSGLNLKMKNQNMLVDLYNCWNEGNLNFLNINPIENTTLGIYGKIFGLFAQIGNVSKNFYYAAGYEGEIGPSKIKIGYFDKDYSYTSFGYKNTTIAAQLTFKLANIEIANETDFCGYAFQKTTTTFKYNDLFAMLSYDASGINTNVRYNYNILGFNGKLSLRYINSEFVFYADENYSLSKEYLVKSQVKFVNSKINWNIEYVYDKDNVQCRLFANNLPISLDSVYDDSDDYSTGSIVFGFGTNIDF